MATFNGRDAKVEVGTYTIAELSSWTLDLSNDEIDTTSFGTTWKKSDVGMRGWTLSVEGFYDPTDTNGQVVVEAAWANGSLVNNVKAYIDSTSYWIPDVTTDSNAGGRVTTYSTNQSHDGVAGLTLTFAGSGPITFV